MLDSTIQQVFNLAGVSTWHPNSQAFVIVINEAECLNGSIQPEYADMLQKIIAALHWPKESVRYLMTNISCLNKHLLQSYQAGLVFGLDFETHERFVGLPSLNAMQNPQAKKAAWQQMKRLKST